MFRFVSDFELRNSDFNSERLGLPARRAYSPEGVIYIVAAILLGILQVSI